MKEEKLSIMGKILIGLFVFFMFMPIKNSMGLTIQNPDNESAIIDVYGDVSVGATNDGSYRETENYSATYDNTSNGGDKTKISYLKDYNAINGYTKVISEFASTGDATSANSNLKVSNIIVYDTKYKGLNGGTFTGTEKVGYRKCQTKGNKEIETFCGSTNVVKDKASADIAMGSSFDIKYGYIRTNANVIGVSSKSDVLPSVGYEIGTTGRGFYFNRDAIGRVQTGMVATLDENNGSTSTLYEQHTRVAGKVRVFKQYQYKSAIKK